MGEQTIPGGKGDFGVVADEGNQDDKASVRVAGSSPGMDGRTAQLDEVCTCHCCVLVVLQQAGVRGVLRVSSTAAARLLACLACPIPAVGARVRIWVIVDVRSICQTGA